MKRMHAKKGLRLAGVLAAVLAIGATPMGNVAPAQAQASQTPSREIVLSIGRGQLVSLPTSISDLFIANEAVADVQVKSARQIYIFGKSGGETTLYASNAAGDIVYSATVRVGSNIDSIDQMLALAMPESKISVATMNGLVLLTGTIASPDDGAEAERLVQAFVGEDTRVVSRLKTATPLQVNLRYASPRSAARWSRRWRTTSRRRTARAGSASVPRERAVISVLLMAQRPFSMV